ncbi:MAG: LysR family transcriptional regulator [Burkholderiaceae bacterium]
MRHLQSFRFVDAVARAGSIRSAAETLAITPSALNRRIQALEEELGVQIFERLPRGVRLSTAGEVLIHHIRTQISDMERVRSQIADLSGVRRGHVSIACSQALLPYFLPEQIACYRRDHPGVTFSVYLRDRAAAEASLVDHSADLALVFEPVRLAEFQTLVTVRQPVHGVMAADHPLASQKTLRLRQCLTYPIALPTAAYGVRHLLEAAMLRSSLTLAPVVESDSFEFLRNYAMSESLISFQIPIGLHAASEVPGLIARPVDERDTPAGTLYVGQLRSRSLPVAAARFADQISAVLQQRYDQ